MNKTYALVGAVLAALVLGGWWYSTQEAVQVPQPAVAEDAAAEPEGASATGTSDYLGSWFKVTYPAAFTARKEGPDEASFTSPDGSVQFFVYSPLWSGNPVSYLEVLPTEHIENATSSEDITPTTNQYGTDYYKKVSRWVTIAANDGSYKRSYVSITAGWVMERDAQDYSSKTSLVFGIKYKDQAAYDANLDAYLAFKESLIQYAD